MPHLKESVTNHAAASFKNQNTWYTYTFYGLDSTKRWTGVHSKVIKTNMETGRSEVITIIPDSLGRLASSASLIKNKIYIAGGYAVFRDGKEKSSNYLFIFDPVTDSFKNGKNIPLPIDDHVQAVWRDSLLYVISGWSDSVNVRAVQVYNPFSNEWLMASPLPDEKEAATFGGCGTIVGDTIYYLGGATFQKFYPPSHKFYKGVINPSNPLRIQWMQAGNYPGEYRYRSVAFRSRNKIYFFGGSNETYNYNGISYEHKKLVNPNTTLLNYDIESGRFAIEKSQIHVMDLRNVVEMENGKFYSVGGMIEKQKVISAIRPIKIR